MFFAEPVPVPVFRRLLRVHLPHVSVVKASLLSTARHVEVLVGELSRSSAGLVLDSGCSAGQNPRHAFGSSSCFLYVHGLG